MSNTEMIFEAVDLRDTVPPLICSTCAQQGMEHKPTGGLPMNKKTQRTVNQQFRPLFDKQMARVIR